jgi:thiamine biosynthesis lipoprotein
VGVQDPFDATRDIAMLNVNDRGVATSGTQNRHWTTNDVRYHHLIDPRIGTSSRSDLASVTVIAPTATQADVLAKSAFLLGSDDGLRFVERFCWAAAVVVTARGDLLMTSWAADYLA